MYQEYPGMKRPSDEAIIWRYMSFTKFVDFLTTASLFFSTVDSLGASDPYEGAMLGVEIANLEQTQETFRTGWKNPDFPIPNLIDDARHVRKRINRAAIVNCWHISDVESAAMWKIYAPDGEGVAIKSSCGRLARSLKEMTVPWFEEGKLSPVHVHIGEVQYVDFKMYTPSSGDMFDTVLRKAQFFEYERELRAVAILDNLLFLRDKQDCPEALRAFATEVQINGGTKMLVDKDMLVDSIVLAPGTKPWLRDLVKKLISEFGPLKPLDPSRMEFVHE